MTRKAVTREWASSLAAETAGGRASFVGKRELPPPKDLRGGQAQSETSEVGRGVKAFIATRVF